MFKPRVSLPSLLPFYAFPSHHFWSVHTNRQKWRVAAHKWVRIGRLVKHQLATVKLGWTFKSFWSADLVKHG